MRGGLTLSRPGPPIALGRRMIPEPEHANRMQHSHMAIETAPATADSHLFRRGLGT